MMRFFEKVMQPTFPRTISEGAMKGFLLGAMVFCSYDLLTPIPATGVELMNKSLTITTGYGVFVLMGALCGLIGKCCLQEENEVQRIRR